MYAQQKSKPTCSFLLPKKLTAENAENTEVFSFFSAPSAHSAVKSFLTKTQFAKLLKLTRYFCHSYSDL
jgi:hypothetical protein